MSLLARLFGLIQLAAAAALITGIAVMLAGLIPAFFGAESFVVLSGSMEPAIHVGAVAVVKGTRLADLKPGDVISYRTPNNPDTVVTHRLIAIEQTEDGRQLLHAKGDASPSEDAIPIDPNAVLGRVLYSVPYAGYIVAFCQRTQGRVILIGLPLLFLAADFIWGQFRPRNRRQATAALPTFAPAVAEPMPPVSAPLAPAPPVAGGPAIGNGVLSSAIAADPEASHITSTLLHGYQALQAGNARGAEDAADSVLALDARNEDGWLLKIQSAPDAETQMALLRTALALNPKAAKLTAVMGVLRSRVPQVSAPRPTPESEQAVK